MTNTGIAKLTQLALNSVNDPFPGVSTNGYSGQPNQYQGQLGAYLVLNEGEANHMSNTTNTLHAGVYQYVQFLSTATNAAAVGGPVYWNAPGAGTGSAASFVVTSDVPTGNPGFAGVALNAVTKGNYGFILVEGFVLAQAVASIGNGSAAAGDPLILTATANKFDDPAAAAITYALHKLIVGQWIGVAVSNTAVVAYISGAQKNGVA